MARNNEDVADQIPVDKRKARDETKELIMKKRKEGKVCVVTIEGLGVIDVNEFIKQPADGILYDLNRGLETTLTVMPVRRWINDVAVAVTITALKKRIAELEAKIDEERAGT